MVVRRIAFRADASSQIGTGHFMRCLTLADELKRQGAHIRFVCRQLPEHLQGMLAARNIEFRLLESNVSPEPIDGLAHSHWLGTSQAQDAKASTQVLSDGLWDCLIVDHYALDERWESVLRKTVKNILAIDDIADRKHDCDLLLDQNYSRTEGRYKTLVPTSCKRLLGPHYALLRGEFQEARKSVEKTGILPFDAKKVLICFGGSDLDNFTGRTLLALKKLGEFKPEVVVGAGHSALEEIKTLMDSMPGSRLHVQTAEMANIMMRCSWYLGAGGSITWERMTLGLTGIVIPVAKNQEAFSSDLAQDGYCMYLPLPAFAEPSSLVESLRGALSKLSNIAEWSSQSMNLVDGNGTARVATEILNCCSE